MPPKLNGLAIRSWLFCVLLFSSVSRGSVDFPGAQELCAQLSSVNPSAAALDLKASRILIVDDEAAIRAYLALALGEDYTVRTAVDGVNALELLPAFNPDVLIVDLHMPRMGGIELSTAVRANPTTQLLPILVLTGVEERTLRIESIRAGVNDFVRKPPDLFELNLRIINLLQQRRLTQRLETFQSVMFSLARAQEARDPYTFGHSVRVGEYAVAIAIELGLSANEQEVIRRSGWLHDVGKIGTPDAVLHSPNALTEGERHLVERHPREGHRILEPLNLTPSIMLAVLHHHERWDGTGYPARLAGENIPLFARIIAVADSFDAMTSSRSYRPAMPRERAIHIIAENTGPQWDPRIVRAFLAAHAANRL